MTREMASGHTGAASELLVAADLIRKGFLCFRNLSPNGGADLIALSPNPEVFDCEGHRQWVSSQMWTIQVKSSKIAHFHNCQVLAVPTENGVDYFRPEYRDAKGGLRTLLRAKRCTPEHNPCFDEWPFEEEQERAR